MLMENEVVQVLTKLKSVSLEEKVEALIKAKEMYGQIFSGCTNLDEWAKSALQVEQLYNYIREILYQPTTRISIPKKEKPATEEKKPKFVSVADTEKRGRPKRHTKASLQMDELFKEFSKIMEESNEKTP